MRAEGSIVRALTFLVESTLGNNTTLPLEPWVTQFRNDLLGQARAGNFERRVSEVFDALVRINQRIEARLNPPPADIFDERTVPTTLPLGTQNNSSIALPLNDGSQITITSSQQPAGGTVNWTRLS